ncbi:MAG: hypothetical protein REI64_05215 [Pedobacter sp.]|nr:hypothetical protein [Pedobacter sp.]MDQ8004179.1 hypothetical protein [Pedobacter sp.]
MSNNNTSEIKPSFLKKKKEIVLSFALPSTLFLSITINPIALNESKDFIN